MNCIEVKNVTKTFNRHAVLDDVSLTVPSGQIIGLVGINGSGKTMLMRCICGFVIPEKGEIFVNGEKVGGKRDFAKDTGIIIEMPGFLPVFSGMTNLAALASYSGKKSREELGKLMEKVGLDPNDKRPVRKYSMGMRQRLGIAQAIMDNPSLLILDEPFNGLDKNGMAEMRKLLMSLRAEGKTMVLASHHFQDIRSLCDRVYEMDGGRITGQYEADEWNKEEENQ